MVNTGRILLFDFILNNTFLSPVTQEQIEFKQKRAKDTYTNDLLNAFNTEVSMGVPTRMAAFATQSVRTLFGVIAIATTIPLTLSASDGLARTLIPMGLPMIAFASLIAAGALDGGA